MKHNIFFEQPYTKTYTIKEHESGQRLDHALKILFPTLGLRGRRRLWEYYKISVNSKQCPQNYKVQTSDNISIEHLENCALLPAKIIKNTIYSINKAFYKNDILKKIDCSIKLKQKYLINKLRISYFLQKDEAKVLLTKNNYIFLYKPSGLHSVSLSGSNNQSLESGLAQLIPDAKQAILVNRLDKETSGLVIATHKPNMLHEWRIIENKGFCEKYYLALVTGYLHKPLIIKNKLDTNKRKKTLVLQETTQNILLHTSIEPLAYLDLNSEQKLTIVGCTIKKGARHQIRAHLAHCGHALWGDAQYGISEKYPFILHHCALHFEQEKIICLPIWLGKLTIYMQKIILDWINSR